MNYGPFFERTSWGQLLRYLNLTKDLGIPEKQERPLEVILMFFVNDTFFKN